jgi:alpha-ketoglutarate-dependent taurine dioxygenase
MGDGESKPVTAKMPGSLKPKALRLSAEALVTTELLNPSTTLPLIVRPNVKAVNLPEWAERNRGFIEERLLHHGALLFRGFKIAGTHEFESFVSALYGELLPYNERSSPRSQVSGSVYTSTEYPADQSIFLHNENSYQYRWPMRLFFYCQTAARQGGETPIADCRNVYNRIDATIRGRFIEKGWMCSRNFGDGFGLRWQEVFQSQDKTAVEDYCRKNSIEVEWKDADRLRTRAIRPAASRHPSTKEMVWFNHATFFHVTTLEQSLRESILALFDDEDDLPTNTYYGDGTPIEPEVLEALRETYRQETVRFAWQEGDVLMLDNMLVAHGRMPYKGPRKVLVAMAVAMDWDELAGK